MIEFEFLSVTWLIPVYACVSWMSLSLEMSLSLRESLRLYMYCTSVLVVLYNEFEDSL